MSALLLRNRSKFWGFFLFTAKGGKGLFLFFVALLRRAKEGFFFRAFARLDFDF
jgi:hypothetical protein